jgi:hypothetical protein
MSIWFVIVLVLLAMMLGIALVALFRVNPREGRTRRNINIDPGIATYTHGEGDVAPTDRTEEPRGATEPREPHEPPGQAR